MPLESKSEFYYLNISSKKNVCLAVSLEDEYRGDAGPIPDGLNVYVKESLTPPIKNLSGYYVFTELAAKHHLICVESKYYFRERQMVNIMELDPNNPLVVLRLKPNPSYPFPNGVTLARAVIRNTDGTPVRGADIKAVPLFGAVAKIASKGTSVGDESISLVGITRKVVSGDILLINDKDELKREYCTISEVADNNAGVRVCRIADPLKFEHAKGTTLAPVTSSLTNENGEMAICFRNTFQKKFAARLEINYNGCVQVTEANITDRAAISLGVILFNKNLNKSKRGGN
jgi:hypothetical protein